MNKDKCARNIYFIYWKWLIKLYVPIVHINCFIFLYSIYYALSFQQTDPWLVCNTLPHLLINHLYVYSHTLFLWKPLIDVYTLIFLYGEIPQSMWDLYISSDEQSQGILVLNMFTVFSVSSPKKSLHPFHTNWSLLVTNISCLVDKNVHPTSQSGAMLMSKWSHRPGSLWAVLASFGI